MTDVGNAAQDLNRYCQLLGVTKEVSIQPQNDGRFRCNLSIPGVQHRSSASGRNKKQAQDSATMDMHRFLKSTGLLDETLSKPTGGNQKKAKKSGSFSVGAASPQAQGGAMGGGGLSRVAASAQLAQLEIQRKQIELEQKRLEIERQQQELLAQQEQLAMQDGSDGGGEEGEDAAEAAWSMPEDELEQALQQVQSSSSASCAPRLTPGKTLLAAPQQKQQASPAPIVEDGMGNFTLENARGLLNQQLKKWKQPSDIKFEPIGPAHQTKFKASLKFYISRRNISVHESIVSSNKKQAQNELSLKICRKLFQMGVMPKFSRSVWKLNSAADAAKESKYKESGSFGVGLPAPLKNRLHSYLSNAGCEVPALGVTVPPETVLMDATIPEESGEIGQDAWASIQPLAWSAPGHGPPAWPPPKFESGAGYVDPGVTERVATLPAASHRDAIVSAVARHRVCIIQGSTGCGKTTQVPQFILDSEDGYEKAIVIAQPRRLPAITVAQRVAAERGEELGGSVGYAVRFDTKWPRQTNSICFMTTGFLLKRLHNRGLQGISHVIVDEVHERDLNNDLFLGLLKTAVAAHSGLKVILMSATIDAVKFKLYMESALGNQERVPLMNIEGRVFNVDTFYLEDAIEMLKWTPPAKKEKEPAADSLLTCDPNTYSPSTLQVLKSIGEHMIPLEIVVEILKKVLHEMSQQGDEGAVLIFQPTWGMISLQIKLLQADPVLVNKCKFVMLHSRVPKEEQLEAFRPAPAGKIKVIVSTNIAESSVTIDDVSVVIDSCKVKINHYSDATGLSHNEVVWTGRMNLEQRKGRAGRTRPGCCFRLCTRRRFEEGLDDEVPPELTRTPLVESALLVKSLHLGDMRAVLGNCLDPPKPAAVARAVAELRFIRAVDDNEELTPLGGVLARMPINPNVGLALLMGHWLFQLGDVMATICAAMSFDEPFPYDKTFGYLPWSFERYKGRHKNSDHFLLGMVHQEFARLYDTQGQDAAMTFCRSEGLHPVTMQQVREATEQLRGILSSPALGSMTPEAGQANSDLELVDGLEETAPRNYSALRDWGPQEWQWGAVLMLLSIALPHLGIHQEKRICWVSEDTMGSMHKGSVNCMGKGNYIFPSPVFAFLEQTKEGGWKPPRCRQLTNLPTALVLARPFASTSVALDAEGTHAVVSGWISIGPAPTDTMCLLLALRAHLEDILVEAASSVFSGAAEGSEIATQHADLVVLLKELLTYNTLKFRESPPVAKTPAAVALPAQPLLVRKGSGSIAASGKGCGWGGGGGGGAWAGRGGVSGGGAWGWGSGGMAKGGNKGRGGSGCVKGGGGWTGGSNGGGKPWGW